MKSWFHRHRWFLIRLVVLVGAHELTLWTLAGRDVTAVLLAPNANTPLHWAVLALLLLVLRILLFVIAPARIVWKLTEPS